jgi:hypothetical protein
MTNDSRIPNGPDAAHRQRDKLTTGMGSKEVHRFCKMIQNRAVQLAIACCRCINSRAEAGNGLFSHGMDLALSLM